MAEKHGTTGSMQKNLSDGDISFQELKQMAEEALLGAKAQRKEQKSREAFWATSSTSQNILLPKASAFVVEKDASAGVNSSHGGRPDEFIQSHSDGIERRLASGTMHGERAVEVENAIEAKKSNKGLFIGVGALAVAAAASFALLGTSKKNEASTNETRTENLLTLNSLPETSLNKADDKGDMPKNDVKTIQKPTLEPKPVGGTKAQAVEKKAIASNLKKDDQAKLDKEKTSKASASRNQTKRVKPESSPAKSPEKTPAKKDVVKSAPTSIDDLLSSATTNNNVSSTSGGLAEKKSAITKTRIDRSDVSKAMAGVTKKTSKCQKIEDATGTVSVKFTVAPTGAILKAGAKGAHSSSKTGKCVVNAVKTAKFPAFNGRPTSFTYPFLMSR